MELFRTWRPHFIWMDVRMPDMDGVSVARHIRALEGGREVKIAAVTASVFAEQRNQVMAAGLDDFVRKPYRPRDIFDCMARHLGVRYRYSESAPPSPSEPATALPLEALAALPKDLRAELRAALIALDVERIDGVIGRVWEWDSALGAALARHSDRFAYTAIFQAIEACQTKSVRESL